jgi:hypothetical protein
LIEFDIYTNDGETLDDLNVIPFFLTGPLHESIKALEEQYQADKQGTVT